MDLQIHFFDGAVLVVYLLAVVAFGLWMGRGQRDVSDYLLGGRNLPWLAVLLSIVATETSTVTLLSVPVFAFKADGGNLCFLQLGFGLILGRLAVVFLFLPSYFRGNLFTAYEVLHQRFGGATKHVASLLFLVTRNLGDGLRLYLSAIVLQEVVGLNLSLCIVTIGVMTIIYTFLGGMKSVVFNDCVQFVVYTAGAILAAVVILDRLPGGWTQLTQYATAHDKFQLWDFSFDLTQPYTFWAGLIGGMFLAMGTHGTDQLMVQRYLAARSRRQASLALSLSGLIVFAQFALVLMIGVGLACFYSLSQTTFKKDDYAFVTFIVKEFPLGIGVVGVMLAALFSAAMSTLSSSLNSSAAAALNDFYLPACREKPSPTKLLWIGRALTVAFGMIQIGVGIGGQYVAKSVADCVFTIAGVATAAILGLFFLGVLTKWATQPGALAGMLIGMSALANLKFTCDLAWPWFAVVGSVTTFLAGAIISLCLPDRRKHGTRTHPIQNDQH